MLSIAIIILLVIGVVLLWYGKHINNEKFIDNGFSTILFADIVIIAADLMQSAGYVVFR